MVTDENTARSVRIADPAMDRDPSTSSSRFDSEVFAENSLLSVDVKWAQQINPAETITYVSAGAESVTELREKELAAQRRIAELEHVNEALGKGLARLSRRNDLDNFLGQTLRAAVAVVGARSGAVDLIDYQSETHRVYPLLRANGDFEPPHTALTAHLPLSARIQTLYKDILLSATACITPSNDERIGPAHLQLQAAEGNQRIAHIPLLAGDRLLGVLQLAFATLEPKFEKEFSVVRSQADQMSLAVEIMRLSDDQKSVENARAQEKAAREHAAELSTANEALRKGVNGLVQLQNLDLFLREMLRVAVATVGARAGAVILLDDDHEFYRFATLLLPDGSFAHEDSPLLWHIKVSPALKHHLNDLVDSSEAGPFPSEDPLSELNTPALNEAEQNHALRHVPMITNGRLIGWLRLGFPNANPELGRNHSLLRVLADQMTMAVEMLRLSEGAKLAAVAREREQAAQASAAELSRTNEQLALRDRLLTASAQALEQLISAADFASGVTEALRQIGEAAGLSRVQVLMETTMTGGGLAHELVHEWWDEVLESQKTLGFLVFPNEDNQEVIDLLHQGERWWARTEDWPSGMQQTFRELGIVWTGVVPIFVQQKYVGLVAFDQCDARREWSEAEIDALTIAAKGIGAALSQERMAAQLVIEREQAAQDRASELVKANKALRTSVDDLVTQTTSDGILTSLLKQAVDISGASSGAILRRLAGSEFEYVRIYSDGVIRSSEQILAAGTNTEMRLASRLDPTGHFKKLVLGETQRREIEDDVLTKHLRRSTTFHRAVGTKRIYDFPYKVAGQVSGFLGLAFAGHEPPTETVQETIKALATQVGLALEFQQISLQVERAAVMAERNMFARDLHDTLAQGFAAIIVQLGAADQVGTIPAAFRPYLSRIEGLARSNLAEARRTVSELRTSERVRDPFLIRLSELARQVESVNDSIVHLHFTGSQRSLPAVVEDELFLIVQESLTNVMKHAEAVESRIEVTFTGSELRLRITDNGKGFSADERSKPDHFGLQTMQERSQRIGAQLTIISEPGFGTEILIVWNGASSE